MGNCSIWVTTWKQKSCKYKLLSKACARHKHKSGELEKKKIKETSQSSICIIRTCRVQLTQPSLQMIYYRSVIYALEAWLRSSASPWFGGVRLLRTNSFATGLRLGSLLQAWRVCRWLSVMAGSGAQSFWSATATCPCLDDVRWVGLEGCGARG